MMDSKMKPRAKQGLASIQYLTRRSVAVVVPAGVLCKSSQCHLYRTIQGIDHIMKVMNIKVKTKFV